MNFLRLVLLVTTAIFFVGSERSAANNDLSTRSGPMNLNVIMTDEHNFRTLGCYRETMQGRQALVIDWDETAAMNDGSDEILDNVVEIPIIDVIDSIR